MLTPAATNQDSSSVIRLVTAARGQPAALTSGSSPLFADWTRSARDDGTTVWLTRFWSSARPVFFGLWIGGSALCVLITARRVVRFDRLLRDTLPSPERLQRLAHEIGGKLGVGEKPRICYVECVDVPLVWSAGDRRSFCRDPAADSSGGRPVLRWLGSLDLSRFRHFYAQAVLKTAEELLSSAEVDVKLLPASPFFQSLSLKARIEMILKPASAPRITAKALVFVAMFSLLILPSFVPSFKTHALASSAMTSRRSPPTARYCDRFRVSVLPQVRAGCNQVRGWRQDRDRRGPRNCRHLHGGQYLLDQGNLHARFTRAGHACRLHHGEGSLAGTGPYLKVQTTVINRGSGTFTLFLPMQYRGWPHVSFYPAEGGGSFGGNYFGTGDSVLKRWW